MTITNNMVAKIAAVVAGLGLVFTAFAPMAQAQTSEELEAQIAALMAQIAALQAGGDADASASVTFTRDLTIGSTGADVTALQNWLIAGGYAIPAGATGYFGTQTQAAVAAYQAANAITPAAGYFGPITRAKVNAAGGADMDDDDDDTSGDGDEDDLEGGEADLDSFEFNDEESEGSEGEEMVEIATIEFDVEDGDVLVQRVEIWASSTNSGLEDRPWDFFDTLYLLDEEGDEVGEIDASDRDEWDEEDGDGSEDRHSVVFNGVDTIVRDGDTAQFTLAADIAGSIDTNDQAQTFEFWVADDGIRAVDSEGIQNYIPSFTGDEPSSGDRVTFGFEAEEAGDLDINSSSDDPDTLTLISDEDDDVEVDDAVFIFELENNDDVDVLVTDVTLTVATTGDSVDNLITDATLVIDGEEADADIDNDTGELTFEDIDAIVGGDEEATAELFIEIAEDADGTVDFSVAASGIEAESDESGDESTVSGSASSDTHTIALTGVSVAGVDNGTDSDVNDDNTIGTFEITFEVTAEGDDDVYLLNRADDNSNNTSTSTSESVVYTIYSGGSAMSATTSDSAILQSGAETETDGNGDEFYVIESGETEEFTLTVSLDPEAGTATAQYYVELTTLRFDEDNDDVSDDSTYSIPDDSDFQTSAETLSAA